MESPSEGQRRWPPSVYGSGDEPDPRYTLANERTFLAWIRTSLALLAGAAAVESLDLPLSDAAQRLTAGWLAAIGLLCATQSWRSWARTEEALRHGRPLPGSLGKLPVTVGVVVVALVLIVAVIVG